MDSAENPPSSSSSSRQGRKTPLSSNTHSLNVAKSKPSQSSTATNSKTVTNSQSASIKPADKRLKKLASDHSASSSEKVKPAAVRRVSAAHTAPVIGSAYTDDTDNDVTTDSDMAHTEEDEKKNNAVIVSGLLSDLAAKKQESKSRSTRQVRPVSAQGHHSSSRDRGSSRDRHTSYERARDRHRSRDRGTKKERDVPSLTLLEQDRQEPDGRSSRQGKGEDKTSDHKTRTSSSPTRHSSDRHTSDRHVTVSDKHVSVSDRHTNASDRRKTSNDRHVTSADRQVKREVTPNKTEGRRSGQSLDRGNNTGSSEPPTVIEVCNYKLVIQFAILQSLYARIYLVVLCCSVLIIKRAPAILGHKVDTLLCYTILWFIMR